MWGMDIETWVSLAVVMTALAGFYMAMRRDITTLRTELKGDISGLRTEMKDDFVALNTRTGRIEDHIATLDDRVYGLAVGLKPIIDERQTA